MKKMMIAIIFFGCFGAQAQSVEPEVLFTFLLTRDESPPNTNSIKLISSDMGESPGVVFTVSQDERFIGISDTGYARIHTLNPASATHISIINQIGGIIHYLDETQLWFIGDDDFIRYNFTTQEIIDSVSYLSILKENKCYSPYFARTPPIYFGCIGGKLFSYDPVTHVVSEITKSDIYPRREYAGKIEGKYRQRIHIDPNTSVLIENTSSFLAVDGQKNVYTISRNEIFKFNTQGEFVGSVKIPPPSVREVNCIEYHPSIGRYCERYIDLSYLTFVVGNSGNLYSVQWHEKDKISIVRWPASAFQP